ncbi:MAG: glycine--tRNA ligase subunit beta [Deltaproteobacteria bacterium]|nr:glycine--tRNA ligase subunit beta [Deltaproteobacteria bacterium]
MKTLLVEIVSEELPAGYIAPALEAMRSAMDAKLTEARIAHGAMKTYGTPRRLALKVEDVADRQAPMTTQVIGPPKAVAFNGQGHPTKAAHGFAKSQGVAVNRLQITTTDRGDYVCVKKTERGLAVRRLLEAIIPEVITGIVFPKSMRWADLDLVFARPIHAIVALLDDRVVPFTLENIKSGRRSLGHRFMHPGSVVVKHASQYPAVLREAGVEPDMAKRRNMVATEIAGAADALNGRVLVDDDLVDTVTNLVEDVVVSAGRFDEGFLEIPREVLITAMREHQKYFAVVDSDNRLLPCFIAVNNTRAGDISVVTRGHERVLRARLEDARFFFEVDSKTPMAEMVDCLKGVMFQAKLGSMYEKVARIEALATHLAGRIDPDIVPVASRAAWLCKADLTSQMVNEFPKLQGVMGRVYAELAGEPAQVARAVEEHYLPAHAGGRLPGTLAGAVVSVADKLDSVCGCFGVGLVPTGTADPYALRRQALGIIQIFLARGVSVSIRSLIEKSLALLEGKTTQDPAATAEQVLVFFQHRLEHLLVERGFAKDTVAAVTATSVDDIPGVLKRAEALQGLRAKPDFESLAVAFKRVVNIIKQARQRGDMAAGYSTISADPALFQDPVEQGVYEAFNRVKKAVLEDFSGRALDQALAMVATLKGPIDDFFDGVMVLTDDETLKQNRLALLREISDLFAVFADFSRIST